MVRVERLPQKRARPCSSRMQGGGWAHACFFSCSIRAVKEHVGQIPRVAKVLQLLRQGGMVAESPQRHRPVLACPHRLRAAVWQNGSANDPAGTKQDNIILTNTTLRLYFFVLLGRHLHAYPRRGGFVRSDYTYQHLHTLIPAMAAGVPPLQ